MKYIVKKESEINDLIIKIFEKFPNTKFFYLNGDLGAGKTTFTKYLAKFLNETNVINSPTFNIMQVHNKLIHIDAYNIRGNLEEFEDFFDDKIVVIEWADNLFLDYSNAIRINIFFKKDNHREFEILEVK